MKLGEFGYRLFLFTCLLNWMAFLLWIIGFNQFRLGLLAACGLMYFTSGFLSIGNLSKIPYRRFTNIKIGFFLSYFLFILCRSFYLYTFGSNQTSFGTFFYDITSFGLIFSSISLIGRTKKELTYFFLVYLLMVILSIVITIPHMTLETLIAADRTQAFQGLEGVRSVDSLQL